MQRLLFFLLFFPLTLVAQELPPVINFSPTDYEAGNQNWMISQAENGNIYIANGLGLVEYTGAKWNLYPVPNNTIVRAVKVVEDKIFTGAYMEAGFWEKDDYGKLQYTSLLPLFPEDVHDGEQFWHIENLDGTVIFQSFDGIYFYHIETGELSELNLPQNLPIPSLYKAGENIYFLIPEKGIYTIHKGEAELLISREILGNSEIIQIFEQKDALQLVTRSGELYNWRGGELEPFNRSLPEKLEGISVFSALKLENGSFLLGSVENGIYHINKEGEFLHHFRQQNGLQNNTVLNLFLDDDKNVWAALDNGLSVLNINSPFRLYQDNVGKIGTVYTSYTYNDHLYLGTNQGLYFRKTGDSYFTFIEGTNGQVWSLQLVDGILFCGHNNGTFIVENGSAKKISERLGTWTVRKLSGKEGYYVQGHYNGFSFLQKDEEGFRDLPMVKDFPHSSKHILTDETGEIWIGNEHKGVFRIRLNDSLNEIKTLNNYTFPNTVGITSSIFNFNQSIYYSATKKLFRFDSRKEEFTTGGELSKVFKELDLVSGRVVRLGNELWAFTENALVKIVPSSLNSGYSSQLVFIPREMRSTPVGYENISKVGDDMYLLGLVNGYLTFNEDIDTDYSEFKIRIDGVSKSTVDEISQRVSLHQKGKLDFKENNVQFHFSIPEYKKFLLPEYSYRLIGLSSRWSEWNTSSSAAFKNLPFGDYEFEVKGKIGDMVTETVSYEFEVDRPWYLNNLAIFIYIVFFILLIFLVHMLYKRHHRKRIREHEKELKVKNLEAEQKIIKLQNEQLEREMAGKSKELAVSTMSLIKKNEFLSSIKQKLKNSESSSEVRSVIKKIDKDISDEDNWKFFKKAFSNADKDFFRKIKDRHPELTSNDLKLCAYLRLNLSSKEIAPLLNISVKSVEIKRYRLRKKMDLPREINLVDYILEI